MRKLEIILTILPLIGILFRILHLPGADILVLIPFTLLAFIYFYFGFALFNGIRFREVFKKSTYSKIEELNIPFGAAAGVALSIGVLGISFKLVSLPGALILLMLGAIGLIIITSIAWVKKETRSDNVFQKVIKRSIPFGLVCVFLLSVPTRTWLTWRFPNNSEYVDSIMEYKADPENEGLRLKMEEERKRMREENQED